MKKPHFLNDQYLQLSFAGLSLQFLFITAMIFYSFFQRITAIHVFLHAFAPISIWVQTIINLNNEKHYIFRNNGIRKRKGILITIHNTLSRHFVIISSLISAIIFLISPVIWWFPETIREYSINAATIPQNIALFLLFILTLVSAISSLFYLRISIQKNHRTFRRNAHYLISFTIICFLFLFDLILECFNISRFKTAIESVIVILNSVLGFEIIFLSILFYFKPTSHKYYYSFESCILESISSPMHTNNIFNSLLWNIFGFDIKNHVLYSFCKRSFFPFVILSVIVTTALSSFVLIKEGEDALLLHFGSICTPTLKPGLHFKLPFPAETIRRYNTKKVRRIHAGSHKAENAPDSSFKKATPLLWTSSNGTSSDELLIVSSPKQMIQNAIESGGKLNITHDKTPSVSLIGADVIIEYVISDLIKHLTSGSDPLHLLSVLAESEISRRLFSYDIDKLLSGKRMQLAKELQRNIRNNCEKSGLGIEILNVAITVVYPPTQIASVFEENVSALQERETKIQQAQKRVLRTQVETAGSVEYFNMLVNLISNEENSSIDNRNETERILLMCGGDISRIIADAIAYRWEKESIERGRIERFNNELILYNNAQKVYCYERYLKILQEALAIKKKIIITKSFQDIFIESGNRNNAISQINLSNSYLSN